MAALHELARPRLWSARSSPLDRFLDWYFANWNTIEFEGSDKDVELQNRVLHVHAEYTSDDIDAAELLNALQTDPLVQQELFMLSGVFYGM